MCPHFQPHPQVPHRCFTETWSTNENPIPRKLSIDLLLDCFSFGFPYLGCWILMELGKSWKIYFRDLIAHPAWFFLSWDRMWSHSLWTIRNQWPATWHKSKGEHPGISPIGSQASVDPALTLESLQHVHTFYGFFEVINQNSREISSSKVHHHVSLCFMTIIGVPSRQPQVISSWLYPPYMIYPHNRRKFRSQTSDLWTDATRAVRAVREEKETEEKESVDRRSRCMKRIRR